MYRYLTLVMLAMCSPALAAAGNSNTDSKATEQPIKTLVFASDKCLLTTPKIEAIEDADRLFAAVLGFLFPLAVDFVFDEVSSSLTKVRKKTSTGNLEFHLWERPQPTFAKGDPNANSKKVRGTDLTYKFPRCVTVLTGRFKGEPKSKFSSEFDFSEPVIHAKQDASIFVDRLSSNGITFDNLNFAFEAELKMSEDKTSYSYEPVFVAAYELIPGNRRKKQGLVLELALEGPGATPWGTAYSTATISLGDTEAGRVLNDYAGDKDGKSLDKLNTGKLLFPGISQDALAAYRRDKGSQEALSLDWLDGQPAACSDDNPILAKEVALGLDCKGKVYSEFKVTQFMPARFRATWTQTRKPSDLEKTVAALLGKAKPKASAWVGERFDSDAKFKASQNELDLEIKYREATAAAEKLRNDPAATQEAKAIAKLKEQKAKEAWDRVKGN